MNILVTGGAGYIGSHTVVALLEQGHQVAIVDNLYNASSVVVERIKAITGKTPPLFDFDLLDKTALDALFAKEHFDAVIHFAGLKAVGESVQDPLRYYRVNLDIALNLLEVMQTHDVKKFVFSSSATVYGSAPSPYQEDGPVGVGINNPYGQTKYMVEKMLGDMAAAEPTLEITILRYFNPVGAHPSGLIGEDPKGIPNNLMPFLSQVAAGKREKLQIFGNDYATPDGTAIRDYIHVVDLAKGHESALTHSHTGLSAYNLGSGKGASVLELVKAFEKAVGKALPYEFATRRAGDLPAYWADVRKAKKELDWQTTKSLDDMCVDTWNWQSKNPNGYEA